MQSDLLVADRLLAKREESIQALIECAYGAGQGWPARFEGLKALNRKRPATRASRDAS